VIPPPALASTPELPKAPRLFLVDGYALIYRAFFAMMSRPLRTARGENTSAAWGVVNFLQRLVEKHRPEYLGWVHDAGTSFRHEVYPEYKATREKLTDELQADFEQGLQRINQLLEAYQVPILALDGYEADDVIGTLAKQGLEQRVNVVIVSGDKDFQQLVQPGVCSLIQDEAGQRASMSSGLVWKTGETVSVCRPVASWITSLWSATARIMFRAFPVSGKRRHRSWSMRMGISTQSWPTRLRSPRSVPGRHYSPMLTVLAYPGNSSRYTRMFP
jgi:hypothetical protein